MIWNNKPLTKEDVLNNIKKASEDIYERSYKNIEDTIVVTPKEMIVLKELGFIKEEK